MKKLLLIFSTLLCVSAYSQVDGKYGSEGLSFHTPQKDTLFLQKGHLITPDIIRIWETDSTIEETKPVIITHTNIAYIREQRLKQYGIRKEIR